MRIFARRHATTAVLMSAVLATGLTACSSSDQEGGGSEQSAMTFVTPFGLDLAVAPVLFAASSGLYEQHGLAVEIVSSSGTAQTMQQVLSGNADIGQGLGIDLINAVSENDAPLIAVATADQVSPFYWVSLANAPMKTPEDFADASVGVMSIGGSSEASLDLMLQGAGMDPAATKRQAVGESAGTISLLEQGRIDAFMGSSDIVALLEGSGKEIYSFPVNDVVPTPGGAYFVRDDYAETNAVDVTAFLGATKEAMEQIIDQQQDLSGVIGSIREKFGDKMPALSNEDDAAAAIVSRIDLWTAFGEDSLLQNNPEQWTQAVDLLERTGRIPAGSDASALYTNDLLPE